MKKGIKQIQSYFIVVSALFLYSLSYWLNDWK